MLRTCCGLLILAALLACSAHAKVYFKETFDGSWTDRWTKSKWKEGEESEGEWKHTAGKWYGDAEKDKGIQTTPDARFYAIWAEMSEELDNKDKDLVLQYSVKHEQKLDCGGGYIKLLPTSSGAQMKDFGGDTPYSIMFGPDICGYSTKKVHVILTYKDKNHLIKEDIKCKTDQLTHVYSLVIHPNNTYKVYIDLAEEKSGSLLEDWDMLPPAKIKDPEATKPEDWDERKKIPDPDDEKPEGWDDIPQFISDPDATKPDDWNDEDDGEWEPPNIPNPEYKGEWKPKMIDNPDYKGKWVPPEIDNPEYVHDDELYHLPPLKFIGFELWQVKSGSIFDNIIVADDFEDARKFAEETWKKMKDGEKEMFDKEEEERRAKEDEERKKREEERKAGGEDEDEDDEDIEDYDEEDDDYMDSLKDEL